MNAPHLVLVHLGSTWFDYIVDCLEQAALFNPDAHLWLVTRRRTGRACRAPCSPGFASSIP
jgi:hypothetical protein